MTTALPLAPLDVAARLQTLLGMDAEHRLLQYDGAWTSLGACARLVAQINELLSSLGAGQYAKIGLLVRNRPVHVSAILAVLSSKRCLVPVTSIQSDAATLADLERSGITILIADGQDWTREELRAGCASRGVLGISVDSAEVHEVVGTRLLGPPDVADGVAVLMPTSGTTGIPKRIPYRYTQLGGALGRVAAYSPATGRSLGGPLQLRSGVVIAALTMAHVAGFWTVLQALSEGRRLALLDRFEPSAWADLVEEHAVRMAMIPPSTLTMVLEAAIAPQKLAALKAIVCGTAPLDPAIGTRFTEQYGIPVLTAYGATEFPGGLVGWSLEDYHRFHASKPRSAGRPRPGIRIRIVDRENGTELPVGDEGLVAVYSPQAAAPSPDGWVVTNDIGRLDEDGFLYIIGRADDAINRGGFKIVPQVIEEILRTHPAVAEAAVVGVDDSRLGQVPVAAVELRAPLSEADLLAWLRERVTKYQVPTQIRAVSELPRTVSMKISKPGVRAIFASSPKPSTRSDETGPDGSSTTTTPMTPAEGAQGPDGGTFRA